MNYTKIQKFIASIIIPFFFFGLVFRFPLDFFESSNAGNTTLYSIVSILVDNEIYDDVKSSVKTYAEDIQKQLKNTKVVIIPTPKNASSFSIASLNENLYYEGYKGIKENTVYESKLVGTVLVGNFSIPVVYKNKESIKTILPYTDFEDKSFIYNHETEKYNKNENNLNGVKPEIWHGIISPNTGSIENNVLAIKNYFEKNHNFYEGSGNFESKKGIINGLTSDKNPDDYKPYVFYFDEFREQAGISYSKFLGYKSYIDNKEDIVYKRYSKPLAEKIKNNVLDDSTTKINDLVSEINPSFDFGTNSNGPDISMSPDILTKHIIDKTTKKFAEVINSSKIGELRKNVNNAGRYSTSGKKVNVDMIPHLISTLDDIGDNILKGVNHTIEGEINDLVINKGLSVNIAIPTTINKTGNNVINNGITEIGCNTNYENILFGKVARNIISASECSIYLGSNSNSGQLVQANRGVNINNISTDMNVCNYGNTKGYWGGNSPVNLDKTKTAQGILSLSSHNLKSAIRPLIDVSGSFKIDDNSKVASPLNCLENNYFVFNNANNNFSDDKSICQTSYQIPINGQNPINWSCSTDNQKYIFKKNFKELYDSVGSIGSVSCGGKQERIYLNNNLLKESTLTGNSNGGGDGEECTIGITHAYYYKTIPSYIKHISPTFEELNIQSESKITPNLGIDKNRYIDFISAKGKLEKINYPYLFRLKSNLANVKTFDSKLRVTSIELDKLLNDKSKEINNTIILNNPSSLSASDYQIYNSYLKNSNYPASNIDLLKFIKDQPSQKIKISGEEKELSYYDSLVFSLFWNNLDSVGQKYKFVFENYLSDQTGTKYKHFLPKNKKIYEIAYLGAPGNAQNMYIKLDPENKGENPFAELDSLNSLLSANILAFNSNNGDGQNNDKGVFKCAPPEGVPLWEWPQAVFCWLGEMDSLKIEKNNSKCSSETLFMDDINQDENDENYEDYVCRTDLNKNGVEDCIEKDLEDANIDLIASSKKSYINKYIGLETRIKNKEGKIIEKLNNVRISYKLLKIEAKKDSSKDLTIENTEVVYDSSSLNETSEKNKKRYILFKNGETPVKRGISKYSLNSKNKEANYYFESSLSIIDKDKKVIKIIKSNIVKIEVREELLFSNTFRINNDGTTKNGSDDIFANDQSNIYLIDLNKTTQNKIKKDINDDSSSKEKLVIALNHYTKGNKQIPLNYPLTLSISKDGKKVLDNINIIENNLTTFKSIYSLKKSGEYKLKITNSLGESTTQTFNILPQIASQIDLNLSTSVLEKSGVNTSNVIILKDKYGNIANGRNYKLLLESDGFFGFPLNEGEILNKKEINVYEGYKGFIIKPSNNIGVGKIKVTVKNNDVVLATKEKSIQVINKININLIKPNNIKVGNSQYTFKAEFTDNAGNLLKNLNTRTYFGINNIYGSTKNYYATVVNGKADIIFTTTNLAGQNIPIELKLEGAYEIKKDNITINPEKPIKLDLILSKYKIKSSSDSKASLRVELKDVYNNLTFNDSTTKVKLHIGDKYKKIITSNLNTIKTIQNGIATFELNGTDTPGTAYFKVSTIGSLENNSFKFGDKIIKGVGEKSISMETFFFWDKETFKNKKYNALYTVMLGAAYGDITKENYLAGSILFDKNNRSLSITSLISNPYKYSDVISFSNMNNVSNISRDSDLSQDINFIPGIDSKNKLFINLYNKALNNQIGKVHYNFSKDTKLGICETTIGECGIKKDINSINLKSIDSSFNVSKIGDKIYLKKSGSKVLTINKDGTFSKNTILQLELNEELKEDLLIFNIKVENKNVAKLIINSTSSSFITSRTLNKTNSLLDTNNNLTIIALSSYQYGTHNVYSESGKLTNIFYNDPFGKSNSLNSFAKSNMYGIERFEDKGDIGWGGNNKFLLNFASGQKVGESVKNNQSIGTINLGDPIISLKKNKNKFTDGTEKSFDSTIGKQLSSDEDISGYRIFDYDNDNKDDILLIKNDGYFKLLENKSHSQPYLNKGNLAYIKDSGVKKFVHAGDFTGDGYDDIFFVNNKGIPSLLNNIDKDFKRYSLNKQFSKLKGQIVQAESFDMDNDGKLDIITLDDEGEINIFYGGGTSNFPIFTKKFIGAGFGIKLSSNIRNNSSFVYFKNLYQLPDIPDKSKAVINEELLNKQIFVKIPYGDNTLKGADAISASIPEGENVSEKTKNAIIDYTTNKKDIKYSGTNYTKTKTFIKSEYSESSGIKIEKRFIDTNGGNLKSKDIIQVEVKITNISNSIKKDIVYIENIEKPFSLTKDKITIEQGKLNMTPPGYDLLIDQINLDSNASTIIKYKLVTPQLTFGNIKVGLFEEKGVFGEDKFGDIIVSKDNKNCSENLKIYNSNNTIIRKYSDLVDRAPICDANKLELPKEINPNIEEESAELLNDINKAKEYAKEKNKELNKEGKEVETKDALKSLDNLNQVTEQYVEELDDLIDGFACGFGGGSCITTPLNWAPLAPGNDPTLFGYPIGDGLKVGEGLPIFSALTGISGAYCAPIPTVWPASPFSFPGGTCGGQLGAGGYLGTNSPTNFVRIFVTPTLTGGMGTAICFGGPAILAGSSIPMGVSPIIPGGNCIVVAKPLPSCSNDGSEGDPGSKGPIDNFGDFGMINGNCSSLNIKGNNNTLDKSFVNEYYKNKDIGKKFNEKFEKEYKRIIKDFSGNTTSGKIGETPLLSINGEGIGGTSIQSSINLPNSGKETFEDILEIKKDRVSPFPSFIMDWATRQIEEAVTKLSDFPTLFVILPDFSGLIDTDWVEHFSKTDDIYKEGVKKENGKRKNTQSKIDSLEEQKVSLKCGNLDNKIKCISLDVKIKQLYGQIGVDFAKGQESGIKTAYEFLGNIPIVNIKPQKINVNIPWLDEKAIDKAIINWNLTLKQWEDEFTLYKLPLSVNDDILISANADISKLISSLKQNISILEEYKKIPRKLTKLLNQKEVYINQVMCNVESISEITSGWIGRNGKRFKAWVQTFIAIKAILKSWQLLIDIFIDYESECHECKNERNNLLNFEFKLIDMIIPKIPVIKFPKWPDIILDLHNIRASINIKLPDINISQRTVQLPTLPKLKLPTANLDLKFDLKLDIPSMPILPMFTIPELPDLPSLPTITLPDLPPPPKLPKLFSSLEGILKILKLITKAMCLLKTLPFVPEWRAGDHIAFLTERNGYLPTDFIDLSLPDFSGIPYVDAIKVTTFVNLEKDNQFLVDMVKNIVEPFNTSTSDISNQFQKSGIDDLDFSNYGVDIKVDIKVDANLEEVKINGNIGENETSFHKVVGKGIVKLFSYIENNKNETVSSKDFINLVNKSLSDISFSNDNNKNLKQIKKVWENTSNYTYSKENALIADLQKNNSEKFSLIKDILTNEINKNNKFKNNLSKYINKDKKLFLKITGESKNKDFVTYSKNLEKYNEKFLISAKNLVEGKTDIERKYIKEESTNLLSRVNGGLATYRKNLGKTNNNLAATDNITANNNISQNACQQANSSPYHYNYEGLYIIEKNKSYKLFNYTEDLTGNEKYSVTDYDLDGDKDLLYFVNGKLYLKENLKIKENLDIEPSGTEILDISDNRYFNGNNFLEAVNGFKEVNAENGVLNLNFDSSTDPSIKHYIIEYYSIVDKFLNKNNSNDGVKKHIIDAYLDDTNTNYKIKKHNVYINSFGKIPAVVLNTVEMIDIGNISTSNNKINISATTRIYTSNEAAKIIYYIGDNENSLIEKEIPKNSSINFEEKIIIDSIKSGKIYSKGKTNISLIGNDIKNYIGLPLFDNSTLRIITDLKDTLKHSEAHIEIKYNGMEDENSINFLQTDSYTYYNLGSKNSSYLVRTDIPNDFYYGKVRAIKGDSIGTYSKQVLFAPQIEADNIAPELNTSNISGNGNIPGKIRIPVYQNKKVDFTNAIYENSGIKGLKDIKINSEGFNDKIKINRTNNNVFIVFGKFNTIFKTKIDIILEDNNGNISTSEVDFEVYSPIPKIEKDNKNKITGSINEDLLGEPINLYRIRSGGVKRLEDKNNKIKVYSVDEGKFNFDYNTNKSTGLLLKNNILDIATINENSGQITIKDSTYNIRVEKTDFLFPQIVIKDYENENVYSQFIKLDKNIDISRVDNFNKISDNGLYLKLIDTNSYNTYEIPNGAKYSAGATAIHKKDNHTKISFKIFPDGRIDYSKNEFYIEYKNTGDNITFELKTRAGDKKIAELLYKINASYLMK